MAPFSLVLLLVCPGTAPLYPPAGKSRKTQRAAAGFAAALFLFFSKMEMDALALLKGFQVHHLAAVEPGFLRSQGDEVAFHGVLQGGGALVGLGVV